MTTPTDDEKAKTEWAASQASQIMLKFDGDPHFKAKMTEMAANVAKAMVSMREQFASVAATVADGLMQFQKNLALVAERIGPVLEGLREGFRHLPKAMREAVLALGREGWFISPDMPLSEPTEAAALVFEGNLAEAEDKLAGYFEDRLDDIEATLVAALPGRAKIISSAFKAHREGRFELSIPVLLAQTDGVCVDIAEGAFFMSEKRRKKKGDRRPETAAYVEGFESDALWSALLSPLGQALPINFTAAERGKDFKGLNRHLVMHGESNDYGTRVNGLKCISLLSYATWVLRDSKNSG